MIGPLCMLLPLFADCAQYTRPAGAPPALVERAREYDRRTVRTWGKVERLEHRISRRGTAYDVFWLCDGMCLRTYNPARTGLHDGQNVSVTGTFYRERTVGGFTFRNEIEATEIAVER